MSNRVKTTAAVMFIFWISALASAAYANDNNIKVIGKEVGYFGVTSLTFVEDMSDGVLAFMFKEEDSRVKADPLIIIFRKPDAMRMRKALTLAWRNRHSAPAYSESGSGFIYDNIQCGGGEVFISLSRDSRETALVAICVETKNRSMRGLFIGTNQSMHRVLSWFNRI